MRRDVLSQGLQLENGNWLKACMLLGLLGAACTNRVGITRYEENAKHFDASVPAMTVRPINPRPEFDASVPATSASVPKSTACTSDDQCDDGVRCNGEEHCNPDADDADENGCVSEAPLCGKLDCDEDSAKCSCAEPDADGDGDDAIACGGNDCDDNDPKRSSLAKEVCDERGDDEDCDATTLGGANDADRDGDGFVGAKCCNIDYAAKGVKTCGTDCDDDQAAVNPMAAEVCNGLDDNCDTQLDVDDQGVSLKLTFYHDRDGDGYGAASDVTYACAAPDASWVDKAGDCADDPAANGNSAAVHPGAKERCDGQVDDNCDAIVDEGCSCDIGATKKCGTFPKLDNGGNPLGECRLGLVTCSSDGVWPASCVGLVDVREETCNNKDDDCDGSVDDNAKDFRTFYHDRDADGVGNTNDKTQACAAADASWVTTSGDCVDDPTAANAKNIYPAQTESCNGRDDNCDSIVDGDFANGDLNTTWYQDLDRDGHGDPKKSVSACGAPDPSYVRKGDDCIDDPNMDPNAGDKFPGNDERCDGYDNNCDSLIDGRSQTNDLKQLYYADKDGDSFPNVRNSMRYCPSQVPSGWTDGKTDKPDCNDDVATVYPGQAELCNGIDDNCDNIVDGKGKTDDLKDTYFADNDGDTYPNTSASMLFCNGQQTKGWINTRTNQPDCNDASTAVNPGASEMCNGVDDNCDGIVDGVSKNDDQKKSYSPDSDGDLYPNTATSSLLCPGQQTQGWVLTNSNPNDCNDRSKPVNPGAAEVCNGVDDNCDGIVDPDNLKQRYSPDSDGDLYPNTATSSLFCQGQQTQGWVLTNSSPNDCNDSSKAVNPGANEVCNGVDDNCDNIVDPENLKQRYSPDVDGDLYPNTATSALFCQGQQTQGWVLTSSNLLDCNDNSKPVNPGAPELCNLIDDDCDGQIDAADTNAQFPDKPSATGTTFSCQRGTWIAQCAADRLQCDNDVNNGCETDATKVTSCHACTSSCKFACGAQTCNEVTQVSTGNDHACAVTGEGALACWGNNNDKQASSGAQSPVKPTLVKELSNVRSVAAGGAHTCAIAGSSNKVYCWGNAKASQTGNSDLSTPVKGMDGASMVASGGRHSCAILSGGVYCWGDNTSGQLGAGTSGGNDASPRRVLEVTGAPLAGVTQIALGDSHSCALTSVVGANTAVYCWGDNSFGQVGTAASRAKQVTTATQVPGSGFLQVAAGGFHTCLLAQRGVVGCFGNNDHFQLGTSKVTSSADPIAVSGLTGALVVTAGSTHTCVTLKDGAAACWGSNATGERGDSSTPKDLETMVQVKNFSGVVTNMGALGYLSAGRGYTCGLSSSQQLYCWGADNVDQLGDGGGSDKPAPTAVLPMQ